MKVWHNIDDFTAHNPVVTIGTFDGVHLGHLEVLKKLKEQAINVKGESVIFTFWPHPKMIIIQNINYKISLINTIEEKIELLSKQDIDHLIIVPFTKKFSQLNFCDFIELYLVTKIKIKSLVFGFNHHFGKNKEGTYENIKNCTQKFKFDIIKQDEYNYNNFKISSTQIRKHLQEGSINEANKLLGYNYSISGIVKKGKALGKKIGFPTANIKIHEDYKIIPKNGVYAVYVIYNNNTYKGMINLGYNPTIKKTDSISFEVNIFNFNDNIYNEHIIVHFHKYLRPEIKFKTIELLVEQLHKDKHKALDVL